MNEIKKPLRLSGLNTKDIRPREAQEVTQASGDSKKAPKLSPSKPPALVKSPAKRIIQDEVSVDKMSKSAKSLSKTANSSTKQDNGAKTISGGKSGSSKEKDMNHQQPQPYKQRHNIGRRVAAERIGSYNEGELAECYPGIGSARWLSGNAEHFIFKTDLSESSKPTSEDLDVESASSTGGRGKKNISKAGKSPSDNKAKKSSNEEESKDDANGLKKSSTSKNKMPVLISNNSTSPVNASRRTSTSSVESRQVRQKGSANKAIKVIKGIPKPKESPTTESNAQKLESKESAISEFVGKRPTKASIPERKQSQDKSSLKSSIKKSASRSSDTAKSSVKKGVVYDSEPEAPRGKRMARLNAEAIMSLMCERDEPVVSRRHQADTGPISFESDSDVNSSLSMDSSDYDDDSARTFRRQVAAKKASDDKREIAAVASLPDRQTSSNQQSKIQLKPATIKKKVFGKEREPEEIDGKSSKLGKIKEDTNAPTASSLPPPKRMASLNAQAFLAASKEDKIKRPRLSGDPLNLVIQKTEEKSPVSGRAIVTSDTGKTVEERHSGGNSSLTVSSSDRSMHTTTTEKQNTDISPRKASCSGSTVVASESSTRPDIIVTSSSSPIKPSSSSGVSGTVARAPVNQSSMTDNSRGRQSSKSQSRHGHQSRNRVSTDRSTSRSQQLSDWQRHSIDGHSSSSGVTGGGFCQSVLAAGQSQAMGFPVATRLTATVAPSPARFNVPVIVPQPSVAGYLAAAGRPPHHAYYPYAAGQNLFAYPVAGYPSTAHSYGSSTVASWSGLQDISQFAYQPGLAASVCQTGTGRGGGVLQQQQLPLHPHQQAAQFFRPCFQPIAQPHQYQNIQPAHSSLTMYPTRLGVVASADVILPSRQISDAAGAKCYDLQAFTGIPSAGSLPLQPSTVPPTQFVSSSASSPSVKAKRSSSSGLIQSNSSPASVASSQGQRDSAIVQSQREVASSSGSDSSSPLVKSYYVLGNDRRSGTVVTESTMVTPSNLLQPFGIYAGCVSAPFSVTGLSPGQTSQAMHLGCFQPAGPLLQMPAFWDMQGFGQVPHLTSVVKQPSVEMAVVEKVPTLSVTHSESRGDSGTQTVGRSGTSGVPSKSSGKKSQAKLFAEQNPGGTGKVKTPKKLETAVVTAIQMSGANHYCGDQERELDLSQKKVVCTPKSNGAEVLATTSGQKVGSGLQTTVDKSIMDLHKNGRKATEVGSSQINNLERFVTGLGADKSKSSAGTQSTIDDKQPKSNPVKKPPKRKLDLSSDASPRSKTEKSHSPSAKKAKISSSCGNSESNSLEDTQNGQKSVEKHVKTPCVALSNESDKNAAYKNIGVVSITHSVPDLSGTDTRNLSAVVVSGNEYACVQAGNEVHTGITQKSPDSCKAYLDVLRNCEPMHLNSALKSPKTLVDLDAALSSVKEVTDTGNTSTLSPAKDSPVILNTKSSCGLESGKKRRKESSGTSAQHKKTMPVESGVEDKLQKQRNAEDSMRKQNRKEAGQWEWHGSGEMKLVHSKVDVPAVMRMCYPAVRHADGDVIFVRDCVLVKSGMRKKDIPYVAKIDKFWEDPDTARVDS